MANEEYKSLWNKAVDERNFTLVFMLKDTPLEDYVKIIRKYFLIVCSYFADDSALVSYGWLMQAISDRILVPLATFSGDVFIFEAEPEEVAEMKALVKAEQLKETMELLKVIPGTQDVANAVALPNPQMRTERIPALVKTRRAMLEFIAARWKETKDEAEADKLFEFLCEYAKKTFENIKLVAEIVWEITDDKFPLNRITRSILAPATGDKGMDGLVENEILKHLKIAWARNNYNFTNCIRILQPLEGCSDEAYETISNLAKQISYLDSEALILKQHLGKMEAGVSFPELSNHGIVFGDTLGIKIVEKADKPDFSEHDAEMAEKIFVEKIKKWKEGREHWYLINFTYAIDKNNPALYFYINSTEIR